MRYAILAPKEAHKAMKMVKRPVTDEKKNIAATHAVMDKIAMSTEKFGYGHTKIFFRYVKFRKRLLGDFVYILQLHWIITIGLAFWV